VPLLRDVTPTSDSAASLRWFFKVDFDQVEEILFFEIASSSTSPTTRLTLPDGEKTAEGSASTPAFSGHREGGRWLASTIPPVTWPTSSRAARSTWSWPPTPIGTRCESSLTASTSTPRWRRLNTTKHERRKLRSCRHPRRQAAVRYHWTERRRRSCSSSRRPATRAQSVRLV